MNEAKKRIAQARNKVPDMPDVPPPPPKVKVTPHDAVAPVVYEYNASDDMPPFDRFDHLAHFLESNPHCYTPGVLNQLKKLVEQYEEMIGGKRTVAAPVNTSEEHARKMLATAEESFVKAIAAYELAAMMMMGCDFNRGLTVATWAKALRVKLTEMKLEGA